MAEDWLPHEPPPTPPKSKANTILIWALLLIVFVIIYAVLTNGPRQSARELLEVESSGYAWWWIPIAGVVGLAVPVVMIVWLFGVQARFNKEAKPGLEALAAGKPQAAAHAFAELAKRFRTRPNHAAVAMYNHGWALLRSGDSAAAVGLLLGAHRRATAGGEQVRQLAAIQLARAFALGGDVERARRWLENAKRKPESLPDAVQGQAFVDAVEAVVLCRAGDVDAALAVYDRAWSVLETYLAINQMTEVWLLRAFAITVTSGPRDSAAAEHLLRLLRTRPAGSVDYLTGHWPELATFVATHGLEGTKALETSA